MDHQLFALSKLDITGDGREEVIACSWVGESLLERRVRIAHLFFALFTGWTDLYSQSGEENSALPV